MALGNGHLPDNSEMALGNGHQPSSSEMALGNGHLPKTVKTDQPTHGGQLLTPRRLRHARLARGATTRRESARGQPVNKRGGIRVARVTIHMTLRMSAGLAAAASRRREQLVSPWHRRCRIRCHC